MSRTHWIDVRPADTIASCGDFASATVSDAGVVTLVLGDVAGRGAIVGAAASTLLAYVLSALTDDVPLKNVMLAVDKFFVRALLKEATPFATLFIASVDVSRCCVKYASAGHEEAIIFERDGRHEHLGPTGPILGLVINQPSTFEYASAVLNPTAALVIVSDGISQAHRQDGGEAMFFGSTGVVRALRDAERSLREPAAEIHRAARMHAGTNLTDDAAVVIFGVKPGPPEQAQILRGEVCGKTARTRV